MDISEDDLRRIIREEVWAALNTRDRIRNDVNDRLGPIREDEQPVGSFMARPSDFDVRKGYSDGNEDGA